LCALPPMRRIVQQVGIGMFGHPRRCGGVPV
jgi:hypothetical protein